ncbi:MAG TPA: hypothetical protein VI215_07025 [Bacteroidota bacterium]|jgi:hypothetical protein
MKLSGKILAVAIIAAQLFTVLFADFGHTDFVFGTPNPVQALASNGAGAKGLQSDWGPGHFCLACYRAANFTARVSSPTFVPATYRAGLVGHTQEVCTSAVCLHSESPRGPPPSFS